MAGALILLGGEAAIADEHEPPIKVPADAIIVPYDPATHDPLAGLLDPNEKKPLPPLVDDQGQRLLVPYAHFLQLERVANPQDKARPTPLADYAIAGEEFSARLDSGEALVVEGHLDVDVLVDRPVSVALPLVGGVLAKTSSDKMQAPTAKSC